MPFELTARDLSRLKGLHPDLVRGIKKAAATSPIQFTVLEGLRTVERQRELYAAKATRTMNSRHIKAKNGFGHAVDIAPLLNGKITWDWPLYNRLAPVVKAAFKTEKVAIEWGGDWVSFRDGPHWQLPWAAYPGK